MASCPSNSRMDIFINDTLDCIEVEGEGPSCPEIGGMNNFINNIVIVY